MAHIDLHFVLFIWGLGDGSTTEEIAVPAGGPEFGFSNPALKAGDRDLQSKLQTAVWVSSGFD